MALDFKEISYEISFNVNNSEYEIHNETVEYLFDVCQYDRLNGDEKESNIVKLFENKLIIKNENGQFSAKLKNEELFKLDDLLPFPLLNMAKNNFKNHNIPLINSPLALAPVPWNLLFNDLGFYDFIPKYCKGHFHENGEIDLLEHGENLSICLNNVLKDKNNKRKFLNLLHDLLPDIEDIDVNIVQGMHVYSIFERFSEYSFPSPMRGDGTGHIIALILALYFEKADSIFIEEPERNIHPALFLSIVHLIKEASLNKQIFLSTQSPELLRNFDLENVYLVSKDENGNSTVSKPITNEILKNLIEDLGMDEVFVDDLFEKLIFSEI